MPNLSVSVSDSVNVPYEGEFTRDETQPDIPFSNFGNYSVHLSHQAEWVTDPFTLKFYSLLQNIISLNFRDGLNFATCQHSLTRDFSN